MFLKCSSATVSATILSLIHLGLWRTTSTGRGLVAGWSHTKATGSLRANTTKSLCAYIHTDNKSSKKQERRWAAKVLIRQKTCVANRQDGSRKQHNGGRHMSERMPKPSHKHPIHESGRHGIENTIMVCKCPFRCTNFNLAPSSSDEPSAHRRSPSLSSTYQHVLIPMSSSSPTTSPVQLSTKSRPPSPSP